MVFFFCSISFPPFAGCVLLRVRDVVRERDFVPGSFLSFYERGALFWLRFWLRFVVLLLGFEKLGWRYFGRANGGGFLLDPVDLTFIPLSRLQPRLVDTLLEICMDRHPA